MKNCVRFCYLNQESLPVPCLVNRSLTLKRMFASLTRNEQLKRTTINCINFSTKRMSSNNVEDIHKTAQHGFVAGSSYDANRPSYTDKAVEFIHEQIKDAYKETNKYDKGSNFSYDILELGAGTGKLTAKIIEKLQMDTKYLATEPMGDFLETLSQNCPRVETRKMAAHETSLQDNSIRCVLAAQCFHWFADQKSITEIHRILSPGGKFVCVWNNKDWSNLWLYQIEQILTEYYDDSPRAVTRGWEKEIRKFKNLVDQKSTMLPGIKFEGTKEDIVNHFSSISVISSLDQSEKKVAQKKMYDVLEAHQETKDSTNIVIPFQTEVFVAVKQGI